MHNKKTDSLFSHAAMIEDFLIQLVCLFFFGCLSVLHNQLSDLEKSVCERKE